LLGDDDDDVAADDDDDDDDDDCYYCHLLLSSSSLLLLLGTISIFLFFTELFFPESHLTHFAHHSSCISTRQTRLSRHPDAAETNHRVGALLAHFPGVAVWGGPGGWAFGMGHPGMTYGISSGMHGKPITGMHIIWVSLGFRKNGWS